MKFAIAIVVNTKLYVNELKYLVLRDIWIMFVQIANTDKTN